MQLLKSQPDIDWLTSQGARCDSKLTIMKDWGYFQNLKLCCLETPWFSYFTQVNVLNQTTSQLATRENTFRRMQHKFTETNMSSALKRDPYLMCTLIILSNHRTSPPFYLSLFTLMLYVSTSNPLMSFNGNETLEDYGSRIKENLRLNEVN